MVVKAFMRTESWKEEVRAIDALAVSMEEKVEMYVHLYNLYEDQDMR